MDKKWNVNCLATDAIRLVKTIAYDHQVPTAFFESKISKAHLVAKLLAIICEIDANQIITNDVKPDDLRRIDNCLESILNMPLFINDAPIHSLMELKDKSETLIKMHDVKCIIVDSPSIGNDNIEAIMNVSEALGMPFTIQIDDNCISLPIKYASSKAWTVSDRATQDRMKDITGEEFRHSWPGSLLMVIYL